MKKIVLFILLALVTTTIPAQTATKARQILDKTTAIVGRKGGASADFTVSSKKIGSTSGTIAIKGNKFHARTPKAIVWYNGKTQWSYLKSTNEVNVSTPTEAQRMRMNPYTFMSMYKNGYKLSSSKEGGNYVVRMVALNKQRTVQEVYLTINAKTYYPSSIKMREGKTWTAITIRNFRAKNQPNSVFTFNAKDYPTAEVVDLR